MRNDRSVPVSRVKLVLFLVALAVIGYGASVAFDGGIWAGIGIGYLGFLLIFGLWCNGMAAKNAGQQQFVEQAAYKTERRTMLPPPPNGERDRRLAINEVEFDDKE